MGSANPARSTTTTAGAAAVGTAAAVGGAAMTGTTANTAAAMTIRPATLNLLMENLLLELRRPGGAEPQSKGAATRPGRRPARPGRSRTRPGLVGRLVTL